MFEIICTNLLFGLNGCLVTEVSTPSYTKSLSPIHITFISIYINTEGGF